ncbi:MAG: DMT family transporter [Immundisolibacteraceae bacterium]|nr:DMT family transporter [Immundisolibacteraceae bacterium]
MNRPEQDADTLEREAPVITDQPEEPTSYSQPVSLRTAVILMLVLIAFWGGNWPAMKTGLQHIPPMTFATARMVSAMLTMTVLAIVLGQMRWPARRDWGFLASAGALQMGIYIALLTYGMQFLTAGRSSILAYTMSLWVVPGAIIFLGEKLTRWNGSGFLLSLVGVGVLFNPVTFDWADQNAILGSGLILLGAAISGGVMIHIRGRQWTASPLALAPWQFLSASIILVPLTLMMEPNPQITWNSELLFSVFYSGPLATALGLWLFVEITRALPAITASLGLLAVPVVGVLLSAWILGEQITATNTMGLTLIIGGVALVTIGGIRGR